MNQSQFYVYSPDGGISGLDTIVVSEGRFSYETALNEKATYIIIFPNYSEQVVFGESGATAKIDGDASHLKEIEITGTKDNEEMTRFRQNANRLSPPEVTKAAAQFIKDHPQSPICIYLINRYFIKAQQPDYVQASELLTLVAKASPSNGRLTRLKKQVDKLKATAIGTRIPAFNTKDINGKSVSKSQLSTKVNVVNVWATWNYDSQNIQRQLDKLRKDHRSDISLLGICIDARVKDCRNAVDRDSIRWTNVCDGKMWNTPLLSTFGLSTVPGNIVIDRSGKVVARNLDANKLKEKIESLLK